MLRDVSVQTRSMRRAKRWLAEMRAEAAKHGRALDAETELLFEHVAICPDCELHEHMDPELCPVADEILDGPDADVGAADVPALEGPLGEVG